MSPTRSVSSTPKTGTKPKPTKSDNNEGFGSFLKLGTAAVKEIGIGGFLAVFFCYIFWQNATVEQNREFIDLFFLFKHVETNPFPFSIVIAILGLVVYFQHYFYKKDNELKEKELDRMSNEKKELQELLNKKALNSSK